MKLLRTSFVLALVLASGACIARVGPGVLAQNWAHRGLGGDDPMVNPAQGYPAHRWAEDEPRIRGPAEEPLPPPESPAPDSRGVDLLKRSTATALAFAAGGWLPLVDVDGYLEEDPTTRQLRRERKEREERRRATHRKHRVDRAPAR